MANSTVRRGRGYGQLGSFEVLNPDGQRFYPGRAVLMIPAHDEAPGWRAILAGFTADDEPVVVPLDGFFGDLKIHKTGPNGANRGGMSLSMDEPRPSDEVDFIAAKVLALSTALAFGLEGRD